MTTRKREKGEKVAKPVRAWAAGMFGEIGHFKGSDMYCVYAKPAKYPNREWPVLIVDPRHYKVVPRSTRRPWCGGRGSDDTRR